MYSFDYVWPYMGWGAALLLALPLAIDLLRSDKTVSRWHDLAEASPSDPIGATGPSRRKHDAG
jgi:hypothetical protein